MMRGRPNRRIGAGNIMRRRALVSAAGTLLAVAILYAYPGFGRPAAAPRPAPRHSHPDILLVTIDAMRADHLSAYGYDRFTSPAIDRFARGATQYTNAIAQA